MSQLQDSTASSGLDKDASNGLDIANIDVSNDLDKDDNSATSPEERNAAAPKEPGYIGSEFRFSKRGRANYRDFFFGAFCRRICTLAQNSVVRQVQLEGIPQKQSDSSSFAIGKITYGLKIHFIYYETFNRQ